MALSKDGIIVSQKNNTLDNIKETGMLDCKPINTPMDPIAKLLPDQGEPYSNPNRYQRLVGKLNYLTMTRHDISFVVSVVSQFINSPCDSHYSLR